MLKVKTTKLYKINDLNYAVFIEDNKELVGLFFTRSEIKKAKERGDNYSGKFRKIENPGKYYGFFLFISIAASAIITYLLEKL